MYLYVMQRAAICCPKDVSCEGPGRVSTARRPWPLLPSHPASRAKIAANYVLRSTDYSKLFPHVAYPNLSKTHDGAPQNFASRKGGMKLFTAINMYARNIAGK